MAHLLAALARDRRYLEPRALPAQAAQDRGDALVRVLGEVDLVEEEPARLAVQRGVVFFQLEDDRSCVPRRVRALAPSTPSSTSVLTNPLISGHAM